MISFRFNLSSGPCATDTVWQRVLRQCGAKASYTNCDVCKRICPGYL